MVFSKFFIYIKHSIGVLIVFTLLLKILFVFEESHLTTVSTQIQLNNNQFNHLINIRFSTNLGTSKKIVEEILNNAIDVPDQVAFETKLGGLVLSTCGVTVHSFSDNKSTLVISRLDLETFSKVKLEEKLKIYTLCNSVRELVKMRGAWIEDEKQYLIVKISRPLFILNDINQKQRDSISNDYWYISSNQMSRDDFTRPFFKFLNLPLVDSLMETYKPLLWLDVNPFRSAEIKSLFFGQISDLYAFKDIDKISNYSELNHYLSNLKQYTTINWSYLASYSIPAILIASLLYCLFLLLFRKVSSFLIFIKTLSKSNYAVLSISSDLIRIKVLISNSIKQNEIDTMRVDYLDKTLSNSKLDYVKYINFTSSKKNFFYKVVSNTHHIKHQNKYYFLLFDSSEMQIELKKYKSIYKIDSLTQLFNRSELAEFLPIVEADNFYYYMGMFDLDFFKKVNDDFGHHFGDLVLRHTAEYLRYNLKIGSLDRIIRLGGEEFMVLIKLTVDEFDDISENISKRIIGFNDGNLSLSGGVVLWNTFETSFDLAYRECDKLLYKAKETGRRKILIRKQNGEFVTITNE